MKVIAILFVVMSIGLGMVILPATPQTATAYNCFVVTHECLDTRNPVDLMSMIFPDAMPRYG